MMKNKSKKVTNGLADPGQESDGRAGEIVAPNGKTRHE